MPTGKRQIQGLKTIIHTTIHQLHVAVFYSSEPLRQVPFVHLPCDFSLRFYLLQWMFEIFHIHSIVKVFQDLQNTFHLKESSSMFLSWPGSGNILCFYFFFLSHLLLPRQTGSTSSHVWISSGILPLLVPF